jgi:uncharacterized repeat protein (TIGR01451 family)
MPLAPAVSAAGPVSYTVNKTVIDVSGQGHAGNVTAAGDLITYQINVNNTAGAPLTNVTVSDPMIGIINNVTNLNEGSNETFYGNYTVTQEDINNNGNGTGFIINNVTVVCDQNTTANNATATVPITSCTIVKTVIDVIGNGNGNVTAAGDIINYKINVNNTAGMDLTNVTVNDPMIGGLLLNMSNLGMGSNETVYGNYTVTQADINNNGNGTGFIINNATVDCDQLGPKNSTVATTIKSCAIVETVTGVTGDGNGNVTAAGDIISYEINVNNTAGMDLTNVTVTDPMLGGLLNVTDLGIGSNETLYGNYTVTQADMNNNGSGTGFIINNATVDCDQLGPKNATVSVPIIQNANCSIVKTETGVNGQPGGNVTAAGDVIDYQINVNNTGNVDLTNVTVTDPLIGNLTGPVESNSNDSILEVGENWIYTGNYTVTQADINNNGTTGDGSIINNATVESDQLSPRSNNDNGTGSNNDNGTGSNNDNGPISNDVVVPIERNPHYSMSKSVIAPDESGDCIVNSPGDEIPYRIVVNNDGNVDLTGVSVNDPMISLTGPTGDDDEDGILNPGETWVFDGIYKLTQDDINNGNTLDNTATVGSNELPEESSDVSQPIEQKVDLSIQKSITGIDEAGDFMVNQPGDVINYRIAVENNGDVDIHNVHVSDSLIDDLSRPTGDSFEPGVLNPGETWIYDGDYIVTTADIESNGDGSGFITNTATVHCNEHSSESSSIMVPIISASNFGNGENPESDLNADFSANPLSGYAPLSVQFTDKSTGSPTSWSWDFNNDGVADSSAQSPAYTYTTPGTYTVNLTVSNANGTNSKPETINVLQTASSNGGGGGGGSIGSATVGGSHSTGNTIATANVTQPENNTSNIEQSTPANVEQTPVQKATSTPAKKSTKTPGFEAICGITALFAAVFIYRRK